jgi:hypothetical protein
MLLLWLAALVVLSLQIVGHFLFQELLHQALDTQTDDRCRAIAFSLQTLAQQLAERFANLLTRWYPIHGVRFLLTDCPLICWGRKDEIA